MFADLVQNSGDIFTADKVRRELAVHHSTADEWLRLLRATMLVDTLPRFARRPIAKLKHKRPKVYATDHGAVAAFLPGPDPLSDPKRRSRVAETAAYRHLREIERAEDGELRYFRSQNGELECDFVLEASNNLILVEVTVSARPRGKIAQLNAIGEGIGASRRVLVYGGLQAVRDQGVELVPLHRFLLDPASSVLGGVP
jgi:predicted AAA+ superfamily ATPase